MSLEAVSLKHSFYNDGIIIFYVSHRILISIEDCCQQHSPEPEGTDWEGGQ